MCKRACAVSRQRGAPRPLLVTSDKRQHHQTGHSVVGSPGRKPAGAAAHVDARPPPAPGCRAREPQPVLCRRLLHTRPCRRSWGPGGAAPALPALNAAARVRFPATESNTPTGFVHVYREKGTGPGVSQYYFTCTSIKSYQVRGKCSCVLGS